MGGQEYKTDKKKICIGLLAHKNRIIQNLQRPLHLRAEIHMSRRIQKRDIHLLPGQTGLLGKNGDPPLPLQGKIVQTGVPVVHPSQSAFGPNAEKAGDAYWEELALCSEALMEEYLETGDLQEKSLASAIRARQLFPCYFGSALKLNGGKQANTYLLFICFIFLSTHGNASFTQIHTFPVYHRNIC